MRRILQPGAALLLSLGAANAAASPQNEPAHLTGYAYSRESGAFLYTETHSREFHDGKLISHRVEYRGPGGNLVASKELDYAQHPFAPTFRTHDVRDGYVEGAEHGGEGYRLFRQAHRGADEESQVVETGATLVADSGFDRYVKAHLEGLISIGHSEFRLAIAGRLAAYDFRATLKERVRLYGRDAVTLVVRPDSLLSLLIDPIYLTYDVGNGRLLRYAGISNIRSPSGDRYDTRIDFPPDGFRPEGEAAGR